MFRRSNFATSVFNILFVVLIYATPSFAQTVVNPPKDAFSVLGVFDKTVSPTNFFNGRVVDVSSTEEISPAEVVKSEKEIKPASLETSQPANRNSMIKSVFIEDGPVVTDPSEDAPMRLTKDAPGSFVGMTEAFRDGDAELAMDYAKQYVRYQKRLIFEVRELSKIIGKAMVDEGVIDEEEWDGVEQFLTYQMAYARRETGAAVKATHEEAMKLVKADPKGKAEIYYFFSLNCSYCREMAGDIERVWQVVKGDSNLKMVGLTLGNLPESWMDSYRDYTGLTLPIYQGDHVAKAFDIVFAPTVVVVSPTTKTAYRKTGQQSFAHLYELVRRVQGKSHEITPEIQKLISTPIGEGEKSRNKLLAGKIVTQDNRVTAGSVNIRNTNTTDTLERF